MVITSHRLPLAGVVIDRRPAGQLLQHHIELATQPLGVGQRLDGPLLTHFGVPAHGLWPAAPGSLRRGEMCGRHRIEARSHVHDAPLRRRLAGRLVTRRRPVWYTAVPVAVFQVRYCRCGAMCVRFDGIEVGAQLVPGNAAAGRGFDRKYPLRRDFRTQPLRYRRLRNAQVFAQGRLRDLVLG